MGTVFYDELKKFAQDHVANASVAQKKMINGYGPTPSIYHFLGEAKKFINKWLGLMGKYYDANNVLAEKRGLINVANKVEKKMKEEKLNDWMLNQRMAMFD